MTTSSGSPLKERSPVVVQPRRDGRVDRPPPRIRWHVWVFFVHHRDPATGLHEWRQCREGGRGVNEVQDLSQGDQPETAKVRTEIGHAALDPCRVGDSQPARLGCSLGEHFWFGIHPDDLRECARQRQCQPARPAPEIEQAAGAIQPKPRPQVREQRRRVRRSEPREVRRDPPVESAPLTLRGHTTIVPSPRRAKGVFCERRTVGSTPWLPPRPILRPS